jgi:hypothetical protein
MPPRRQRSALGVLLQRQPKAAVRIMKAKLEIRR